MQLKGLLRLVWLESIAGGTPGNFSSNVSVDGRPEHCLPGPALRGLETRVALVQLLNVVMLEGVWNDEPPSTEKQTTVTREFLSHGVAPP